MEVNNTVDNVELKAGTGNAKVTIEKSMFATLLYHMMRLSFLEIEMPDVFSEFQKACLYNQLVNAYVDLYLNYLNKEIDEDKAVNISFAIQDEIDAIFDTVNNLTTRVEVDDLKEMPEFSMADLNMNLERLFEQEKITQSIDDKDKAKESQNKMDKDAKSKQESKDKSIQRINEVYL